MKKIGWILILGAVVLGIVLPNLIANGVDIPIGIISVIGLIVIVLPFVLGGGGNNGE